jgi:hypothetical protein
MASERSIARRLPSVTGVEDGRGGEAIGMFGRPR